MSHSRLCICVAFVASLVLNASILSASSSPRKGPARHSGTPTTRRSDRPLKGDLVGINIETKVLTVRVSHKDQTTELAIETDAATQFQLDGEEVTLVDLKPDMKVSVTPDTGTAMVVSAKSISRKEQKKINEQGSAGHHGKHARPAKPA